MLEYIDSMICFREIPDEISLGFSIAGCKRMCEGCHSPELWYFSNYRHTKPLSFKKIKMGLSKNKGITTILFLGGDEKHTKESLHDILGKCYYEFPHIKLALYSGFDLETVLNSSFKFYLNYLKVGKYEKDLGGLDSPNTNQRLYTMFNGNIKDDITYKFWNREDI